MGTPLLARRVGGILKRRLASRASGGVDAVSIGSEWPRAKLHPVRGRIARSRATRWRAAALILVHVIALAHLAHWQVARQTLSPLEPSEAMQTLELGYVNAGFLLFLVAIAATLILGRFFCGWTCHLVAYQDLTAALLRKVGWEPRPLRSRLLQWVPLGAALYMFVWPQVLRLLEGRSFPPLVAHLTTDAFWATFPGPWIAALTFAVDGMLIVWLLGSKAFCTFGCPYGAVLAVADRFAVGKIRVSDACEHCGHCTAKCSSNVQVHAEVARHGMVVDPGCMKCLDCVSVCPTKALSFGFGRPTWRETLRRPLKRPAYDLTWTEECLAGAGFLVALYAYRGLYDLVPFLLAVGLAVMTAVLAVAALRMLRSDQMTLQHHVLRSEGRFRRSGWLVMLASALLATVVVHSVFVQASRREGERLLFRAEAMSEELRSPVLEKSLAHLARAERWGLLPVAKLHHQIGSIHRAQERAALAEHHMRRAIDIDPDRIVPRMELAEILIRAGRFGEAVPELAAVLERQPDHATAQRWLDEARRRQ